MDVYCAKCGEPWAIDCQHDGIFSKEEWLNLISGKNCPACVDQDEVCPECDGTGLFPASYSRSSCPLCWGRRYVEAIRHKNIGYMPDQGWWIPRMNGRRPIAREEFKFFKNLRLKADRETYHIDGWAQHVWVYCPHCAHEAEQCPVCHGTGKAEPSERTYEHDDAFFDGLENLDVDVSHLLI
jgi:hypothetical protein